MNEIGIDRCDLLVLCGGQGTRLRTVVHDRPKPMVMIEGRPFVDAVIESCVRQGIRRVILCTGYMGHHFEDWYLGRERAYGLFFSQEQSPLGTAGAVMHAASLIRSNPFLVVNGDSLCETDLKALLAFHAEHGGVATLALTTAGSRTDVGFVTMHRDGRISAFAEKQPGASAGFHNAGIYVFERSVLEGWPAHRPCSIEEDLLPKILGQGVYGLICDSPLYDIGTPERLEEFRRQAATGAREAGKSSSSHKTKGAVNLL